MITYTSPANTGSKTQYDFSGLSTDTKPLIADFPDMDNGSSFMEIDTKELKFYDAENDTWV